jgi:hypothetical protein
MKTAIIATPIYQGVHEHFAASLEETAHDMHRFGWALIPKMRPGSLLAHNRCGLAADFLYNQRADVLLWIDSDEGWRSGDIAAVLEATNQTPFVGGAYRKKYPTIADLPWEAIRQAALDGVPANELQFVGQDFAFGFMPEDIDAERGYVGPTKTNYGRRLIRVSFCGTGFLAMRRDALLDVAEKTPKTNSGMPILFNNLFNDRGEGKFDGEDVFFCKLARDAGYEIWLDTETLVDHYGMIGVRGDARGDRLHDFARMIHRMTSGDALALVKLQEQQRRR